MTDLTSLLSFDAFVSGEVLSASLGITRAAVWKRIEALRSAGIEIEGGGRKGYRLINNPESLNPLYWQRRIQTDTLGRNAIYQKEMTSTNTVLKRAAQDGAFNGTVALCDMQTQGRGRLDRSWEMAQIGSQLTCSVLLRPSLPTEKAPLFTLITGLSLAQAMETPDFSPGIKWPNDLVHNGKKLAGILLEMAADMDGLKYVVIGTGVNLTPYAYPQALKDHAISLSECCETPPTRQDLLLRTLYFMEKNTRLFEKHGFEALKADYEKRCVTLQSRVKVVGTQTFTGTAEAIDETGALMVADENNKIHRVIYGDVSVRGVMGYV